MKRTGLLATIVGFAAIAAVPPDASAYYHAQMGRFINRDPIGYEGGDVNLYRYVRGQVTSAVDPSGLLVVCCRAMHGNWYERLLITHCQIRNRCVEGETSYDVWVDRSQRRCMDNGIKCSTATKQDIERCLRRIPHSDRPYGGNKVVDNNCQTGTMRRLGECCLKSNWRRNWYAGNYRGRCLEWKTVYLAVANPRWSYRVCVKYDWPNWYSSAQPGSENPDSPIAPIIDDESHGGWPFNEGAPGVDYPEY